MTHTERTKRTAYIVNPDGKAEKLYKLPYMTDIYNEKWLQNLIAENPAIIPTTDFGV